MDATVTLTVTDGLLRGKRLVFRGPAVCTVGRAADCDLQVPTHDLTMDVSRHHCWFDIDPPAVRVFDSRSRNGTYVNGVNIAAGNERRRCGEGAFGGLELAELHDGDEVRVGHLAIRVVTGVTRDRAGRRAGAGGRVLAGAV
jgi:serine/threonine-protein kinase